MPTLVVLEVQASAPDWLRMRLWSGEAPRGSKHRKVVEGLTSNFTAHHITFWLPGQKEWEQTMTPAPAAGLSLALTLLRVTAGPSCRVNPRAELPPVTQAEPSCKIDPSKCPACGKKLRIQAVEPAKRAAGLQELLACIKILRRRRQVHDHQHNVVEAEVTGDLIEVLQRVLGYSFRRLACNFKRDSSSFFLWH